MLSKTIEQVLYSDSGKAYAHAVDRNSYLTMATLSPVIAGGFGYLDYKMAKNKPKSFLGRTTLKRLEATNEKRRKAGKKPLSLKQRIIRDSLWQASALTSANLGFAGYHHYKMKKYLK